MQVHVHKLQLLIYMYGLIYLSKGASPLILTYLNSHSLEMLPTKFG